MSIQGVNLQLHPAPPLAMRPAVATAPVQSAQPTRPLVHNAEWLKSLVAGSVHSGINRGEGFDEVPTNGSGAHQQGSSLKLYTRSADCVEAATGYTRGRMLDITA